MTPHPKKVKPKFKAVKAWAIIDKQTGKIWGWKGHFEIHRTKGACLWTLQGETENDTAIQVQIHIPTKRGER